MHAKRYDSIPEFMPTQRSSAGVYAPLAVGRSYQIAHRTLPEKKQAHLAAFVWAATLAWGTAIRSLVGKER